jgi:hypothetical protein
MVPVTGTAPAYIDVARTTTGYVVLVAQVAGTLAELRYQQVTSSAAFGMPLSVSFKMANAWAAPTVVTSAVRRGAAWTFTDGTGAHHHVLQRCVD